MASQPIPDPAEKLARFPLEVRDAYRRYRESGSLADVHIVVLAVLRNHMPKRTEVELTDSMRLIEDLGFDSLAVAETVFFIEDLFQVRIETQELMTLRTVGELREFIATKLGRKATAT